MSNELIELDATELLDTISDLRREIKVMRRDFQDMEAWGKEQLSFAVRRGNMLRVAVDAIGEIFAITNDAQTKLIARRAIENLGKIRTPDSRVHCSAYAVRCDAFETKLDKIGEKNECE